MNKPPTRLCRSRRLHIHFCRHAVSARSVGQTSSALCAASLQYVSAVGGFHSLAEAVHFASLALFRLIGSKHFWTLLTDIGN